MTTFQLKVHFPLRYVAHPYWPEMNTIINVQKESGMNRARTQANRRKTLEEWLRANNKTLAWYEDIEKRAARQFYIDSDGKIIIPEIQIYGFLVCTADEARAATRACNPDQIRSLISVSPLITSKTKADGVWERFAVVSAGTGQKLSNQRGFRSNEYIENFDAIGSIIIDPNFVKPEALLKMIEFGGRNVGLGASRKMGCGRFDVVSFDKI